jgi:hypothetical protein
MQFFWFLGLLGLLFSTIYTALAIWAALRFAKRRRTTQASEFRHQVSLLKRLNGSEPELERRLTRVSWNLTPFDPTRKARSARQ